MIGIKFHLMNIYWDPFISLCGEHFHLCSLLNDLIHENNPWSLHSNDSPNIWKNSNFNIHHILRNPKLPLTFANQRPRCKNISHPFHRLKASFTKHRCLVSTETPIWRKSNIYYTVYVNVYDYIILYHFLCLYIV
jgi:hypothetical protein